MSKLKLVEGQVIAQIDTTQVYASEREGSGFIFMLDMDGKAVLNGEAVSVGFSGSNMGLSECFGDFAKKIAKLLIPYSIKPETIGLTEEHIEESLTKTILEWIAEELNVGSTFELVFKDNELRMVELSHNEDNYTSEEELEGEEEDEDDNFELGDDDDE